MSVKQYSFLLMVPLLFADQCRISKIPAYRNKYNCRAYWICIDGKSYGKCCQPGHTYVEGSGCVQNNSCRHSCQVNQLLPGMYSTPTSRTGCETKVNIKVDRTFLFLRQNWLPHETKELSLTYYLPRTVMGGKKKWIRLSKGH